MNILSEHLIKKGLVKQSEAEGCEAAYNSQSVQYPERGVTKSLGEIYLTKGLITEKELGDAFLRISKKTCVDLDNIKPDQKAAELIPEKAAYKYGMIAFCENDGQLFLAMKDVTDLTAIEKAAYYSRKKIKAYYCSPFSINRAILDIYGSKNTDQAISDMTALAGAYVVAEAADALSDDSGPTARFVDSILRRAVAEGASDVHIEAGENDTVTRIRVDGVLRQLQRTPVNLHETVAARIKIMGNMDVSKKRIPQDGRASMMIAGEQTDLRISTLPAVSGEKIVIRILRKEGVINDKHSLGLTGENLKAYDELLKNKSGMILIAGPTGSGKSTTMMTMIKQLNSSKVNIITLEDPVEYHIEGVTQVQINEKTGLSFASALKAVLRQDPDIICVGEIRDSETARIAMRAAITGHLVISTLHTTDAALTIERLRDMGAEDYLIASSLKGVISQRLVRLLCTQCRKKDAEGRYYEAVGCIRCGKSGFRGRVGIFEIMRITDSLRSLIRNGADREKILNAARHEGFTRLKDCMEKILSTGLTSVSEAERTDIS